MILSNNYKMVIKVPIDNVDRKRAEKSLRELISSYKEDITIEDRKSKIEKILSKINPLK